MTAVAADFDNDGWPDIYVACDSTPSFLLRNNRNGTFTDIGLESGVALNEDGMEQAGMGVGVGDYNLDGNLDIFKTHFADDTNILYRNDGKGNFEDATISAGLGVETRFIGWGAGIVDLDNDGNPDLFFVTGSVYPEVEAKLPEYPFKTPRVIFRNLGDGVRGIDGPGGTGSGGGARQPRLRVRRFRQRWRHRHGDREPERAAFAAAQRCERRRALAESEAGSDQPLRNVGLRYLFASALLVKRIFAASHSSLPATRRAIAPNSIHSTKGTATLKFEHAGSPPLQARIQSR
jgi:hypothetical protein